MAFCTECGANNPAGTRFCTSCGHPLEAEPAPQAPPPAATLPDILDEIVPEPYAEPAPEPIPVPIPQPQVQPQPARQAPQYQQPQYQQPEYQQPQYQQPAYQQPPAPQPQQYQQAPAYQPQPQPQPQPRQPQPQPSYANAQQNRPSGGNYVVNTALASNAPPTGRYKVHTVWGYIGNMIVLSIPLVGFIMALVWSFSGSVNLNRRNFARAYLILMVIGIVISAAIALVWYFIIWPAIMSVLQEYINQLPVDELQGLRDLLNGFNFGSLPIG